MNIRSMEKIIFWVQILAAIGLGIACFLPFYENSTGEVRYAYQHWGLFFWPIPVIAILYILENRWLRAILCLLAAIGSAVPFVLLTFLATFKSIPLVGFSLARAAIVLLALGWLVLCGLALGRPKAAQ